MGGSNLSVSVSYTISVQRDLLKTCPMFSPGLGAEVVLRVWGLSQQHSLECGVPQGTIIFPMLFNIYIHPLTQTVWGYGLSFH